MTKRLCLVYLFAVVISVSSNPHGQLVQSCNVCQPSSYSNPTSIPVMMQQPSNTNPYPQSQVPVGYPDALGDNLNQIIMNRILSNPSFKKIIDPNTKLFNQNGEEVQRQVPNTGVPNVVNNYFIVPPEFFKLNETVVKNKDEEVNIAQVIRKPHRRKLKRRSKKVELSSDDDDNVVVTKRPKKRRKLNESEKKKRKRKRINNADERSDGEIYKSVEIDTKKGSQEIDTRREEKTAKNKQKQRLRKKNKNEQTTTLLSNEESNKDDFQEEEPIKLKKGKEIEEPRKPEPKTDRKVICEEPHTIVPDKSKVKQVKDDAVINKENISEHKTDTSQDKKNKKYQRKESSEKSEAKILSNIEIPTDTTHGDSAENRQTRDSKRNAAKREPKQKITPFPDDVMKNYFPYMPMGNFNNPYTNYPYNFDQYYQYLNPVTNANANRNKKRRKNQNIKNKDPNSNIHTIEIKLKPKKKENTTETPVTTENPKDVHEVTISIEMEQSTESLEEVTAIPMVMPHKVSPINKDENESMSKENYETFSKLEDFHEFITPELGREDEVPNMNNNGIINDYYPVFDDDVYYNPYVEEIKNIEDDRYFYETGKEDNTEIEKRKYDRYEDSRGPKRNSNPRELENPDFKTTKIEQIDQDINKYDHNEYLNHKATFSDNESPEHDIVKSSEGIRRVTVPPKNKRLKSDSIETIFAKSKVAIYGVPLDETVENSSSYIQNSDESNSNSGHATYVIAKSLGPPEDYW